MTVDVVSYADEAQAQLFYVLQDLGLDVTYGRATVTSPGPEPVVTYTDTTVRVIPQDYRRSAVDGELVQQGDRRLFVAAGSSSGQLAQEPQLVDQITIGSDVFKVVAWTNVVQQGLVKGYRIQVRR